MWLWKIPFIVCISLRKGCFFFIFSVVRLCVAVFLSDLVKMLKFDRPSFPMSDLFVFVLSFCLSSASKRTSLTGTWSTTSMRSIPETSASSQSECVRTWMGWAFCWDLHFHCTVLKGHRAALWLSSPSCTLKKWGQGGIFVLNWPWGLKINIFFLQTHKFYLFYLNLKKLIRGHIINFNPLIKRIITQIPSNTCW